MMSAMKYWKTYLQIANFMEIVSLVVNDLFHTGYHPSMAYF